MCSPKFHCGSFAHPGRPPDMVPCGFFQFPGRPSDFLCHKPPRFLHSHGWPSRLHLRPPDLIHHCCCSPDLAVFSGQPLGCPPELYFFVLKPSFQGLLHKPGVLEGSQVERKASFYIDYRPTSYKN
ncbi:hypothetical protein AMECASPLE_011766 [Ameca splendens]|uniref:Uncharacterized protein n=1 Tax=Ameca splendens TaxID=208324 RepID=A0ABV0YNQ0_9TELE